MSPLHRDRKYQLPAYLSACLTVRQRVNRPPADLPACLPEPGRKPQGSDQRMRESSFSTLLLTGKLRGETANPRSELNKKEWKESRAEQRASLGVRDPSRPGPLWISKERSPGTGGPEEGLGRIRPSAGESGPRAHTPYSGEKVNLRRTRE